MIQFNEANRSKSSLKSIALVNGGIAINNHHVSPQWRSETAQ